MALDGQSRLVALDGQSRLVSHKCIQTKRSACFLINFHTLDITTLQACDSIRSTVDIGYMVKSDIWSIFALLFGPIC